MQVELRAGSLHEVFRPSKIGLAEIRIDTPDPLTRMRAERDGQPLYAEKYTRLIVGGELYMTDAEFEKRTNLYAVASMKGDVLVAGLGLGFMLRPTLAKGEVSSVTVIEKFHDVIALVEPFIRHEKLKIINADCKEFAVPMRAFDCIYFDIWPDIPNSDNKEEIKALKKQYRPALRKGGWMRAWCEEYTKR